MTTIDTPADTREFAKKLLEDPSFASAMSGVVMEAVLMEREACAKMCDAAANEWAAFHAVAPSAALDCAARIRRR